jgi:hypothetical protein
VSLKRRRYYIDGNLFDVWSELSPSFKKKYEII